MATKTTDPTHWTTAAWPATVTGLQRLPNGGTGVRVTTDHGLDVALDFPPGHPIPNLGEPIHLTLRRGPVEAP